MPLAKSIRTSRRAEEIIESLAEFTGMKQPSLALMAICLSIQANRDIPPINEPSDGYEINTYSLTSNSQDPLLEPLFSLTYQKNFVQDTDSELLTRYVRTHLNQGLYLLQELRQEVGGDKFDFFMALERKYTSPVNASANGSPSNRSTLSVRIGSAQGKDVLWDYNDTERYPNQHVAIMGVPGSGKTQFLMSLLTGLREASQYQVQAVVFDYKGDLAGNSQFVERMKAIVYDPSNKPLPFNPFILPDYEEKALRRFAAEMTNTIEAANSIGIVQQARLREGIIAAYERRRDTDTPQTDFEEVSALIRERTDKHDTLTELLERLADYELFEGNNAMQDISQPLHHRTCIIDLSRLNFYKELVAYIVLDRLYREMKSMGDSGVEDNRREMRLLIAIDEAHHYLKANNPVLDLLIREGRSYGLGVFLSSQSVMDYEKQKTDYSEFINNVFMFQIGRASSSQLQRLIRTERAEAERLLTEALALPPGECLWNASTEMNKKSSFTRLQAGQFYRDTFR